MPWIQRQHFAPSNMRGKKKKKREKKVGKDDGKKAAYRLTVKRYSTARSGLLNAARIAASIWLLSNPMASMFAIASARSGPMARPVGPPLGASVLRCGVG